MLYQTFQEKIRYPPGGPFDLLSFAQLLRAETVRQKGIRRHQKAAGDLSCIARYEFTDSLGFSYDRRKHSCFIYEILFPSFKQLGSDVCQEVVETLSVVLDAVKAIDHPL